MNKNQNVKRKINLAFVINFPVYEYIMYIKMEFQDYVNFF